MSETNRDESIKNIAAIIKDVKFAMLTTTNAEGHLHARPMTVREQEFDGDLWFIGNREGESADDIPARPQVNVSFSKPEKSEYLSIYGTAELVDDQAKLDELWSDVFKAYYPEGKSDPKIQLIKVTAHGAEYWQGEGRARTIFEMIKGIVSKEQADLGKHDSVKL